MNELMKSDDDDQPVPSLIILVIQCQTDQGT